MMRRILSSPWLHNVGFALLVLGFTAAIGYFGAQHRLQRDITLNASNSLEPASIKVLGQLGGRLDITVYATEQDARLGDIRRLIREFISLYQRYKPDLALTFVDPEKEPEKARAAGIQLNGEMVVSYAGRSEHLTQLNEPTLTAALLRLARSREQLVMYLDGHGERKLDGAANHDLGELFGAKLKQNGFHLSSLNLALAQEVPDNASMLVITQPQVPLLPGETDKLLRYVERGGNLLWLLDAEPLRGLEPLAERLDLLLPPGIVIDPSAAEMNAPMTWALGAAYPPHAITNEFNLITAFPSARPLAWNENLGWEHHPLLEVAPRGWISRSVPQASARFDKRHDTPGPATIAVALQRHINDREQRIVVVGSGDFLSNTFAGNGGNLDFGVNMVNWLASEDRLIALQPHATKDSRLILSKTQLTTISFGFMIGLPLLLAAVGARMWWKRRHA